MIARIYGGKLAGTYEVEDLWKFANGKSEDLSELRDRGCCVHRAELDNQPMLEGYCGPMWDGDALRYETWDIYEALSI